jgi:hypothetical protein
VSKLTLSVDDAVIERAKRYAARRGLSDEAPVLRMLEGAGKGAALDDYRRYLSKKYR